MPGALRPSKAMLVVVLALGSASAICREEGRPGSKASKPSARSSCTIPPPASDFLVNVKDPAFGAMGDGVANDTLALQKAINAVGGTGGTVLVPAGTYLVDPVAQNHAGIRLRNDMTLRLEVGAVLKALPTSTADYVVLLAGGVKNVTIQGGTILGNRHHNTIRDSREGGIGLKVVRSRGVQVHGLRANQCWLDGFYVGESSQDVTFCHVVADDNRRQGLSITSVDGLIVKNSTFKNTTGYLADGALTCGMGADIEPNHGQTVSRVQFLGCTFASNAGEGLAVGPAVANRGRAFVTEVLIEGNTVTGNGLRAGACGIGISNTSGHRVLNNIVTNNTGHGIYLRNQANQILMTGNTVTGTKAAAPARGIGYGILLYDTAGNTVMGNTIRNNAACGLRDAYPMGANTIGPNQLQNNHPDVCP